MKQAILLLAALLLYSPQAAAQLKMESREFTVVSVEYNLKKSPAVVRKNFKSIIKTTTQGSVRYFEMHNFYSGDEKKADVIVKLALSGPTASNAIFNGDDELVRTFPDGRVISNNLAIFDYKTGDFTGHGRWIVSEKTLTSLLEVVAKDGTVVFSEFAVYQLVEK